MDDETIILTDENGEEAEFEYLDSVEYEGREYVVLFPVDDDDDNDSEVIILVVEEYNEDTDEETFGPVEDEETLNKVFELFKEAHKDEYNFTE
ncbi:MAG: DUF1292 domain-containing protein [Oscillospiraceae bacterium]|nr:DUF1292 domain-containing protein [Oscillospiraceae bacterium]